MVDYVDVEVEFDYEAELKDELTIRTGDIIKDVKQMEGGWWEGSLKGRRGVFPDNFVRVINSDGSKAKKKTSKIDVEPIESANESNIVELRNNSMERNSSPTSKSEVKSKRCRVLFSYSPTHEDELELKLDDVIDVVGEVEDGWWRGNLNGKSGVFPSNFVELITNSSLEPLNNSSLNTSLNTSLKSNKASNARQPLATENKNLKNEINKDPVHSKPASKISNLIKEAEAKYGSNLRSRNISSSSENLNPNSTEKIRRQSPVGRESLNKVAAKSISSFNAPKLPPKPVKEQCRVQFPYKAVNDDELTLAEGQIVNILTKEVEDKGWWKGEVDGRIGVFPDNFVVLLPPTEVSSPPQAKTQSDEGKAKKPVRPPNAAPATLSPAPKDNSKISASFARKGSLTDKGAIPSKPKAPNSSLTNLNSQKQPQSSSSKDSIENRRSSLSSKTTPPPKPKPPNQTAKPTSKQISNPVKTGGGMFSKFNLSKSSSSNSSASKTPQTAEKSDPPTQDEPGIDMDLDLIQIQTDKLAHPTAERAKAPKRRPPSSAFSKQTKSSTSIVVASNVKPPSYLSKSLEDMADIGGSNRRKSSDNLGNSSEPKPDEFSRQIDRKEINKGRLSFKLVRQVKDVFGGLTNGSALTNHHSSAVPSKTNGVHVVSDVTKKVAPPKPPVAAVPAEKPTADIIHPKSEEPKKPEWLEELSRKQAVRKSVLLNKDQDPPMMSSANKKDENVTPSSPSQQVDSPKPQIPLKPSQIRENEVRKSLPVGTLPSKPISSTDNSLNTSLPTTSLSSSTVPLQLRATSSSPENVKIPNVTSPSVVPLSGESMTEKTLFSQEVEKPQPTENLEDLEQLSLIERIRRLETLMVTTTEEFESKVAQLTEKLDNERNARIRLEQEVATLRRT